MTGSSSRFTRFTYHLNEDNRITLVDNAWLEFARSTNAQSLLDANLIGTSVWNFIASAEVRVLYQAIYDKVRRTLAPMTLGFRCDGPDVRRFMSLEISMGDDYNLQHTSRLLKAEPREPIPWFNPAESQQTNPDNPLLMCSWCCRIKADKGWEEIEQAMVSLDLVEPTMPPAFRQGICHDCGNRVEYQLD